MKKIVLFLICIVIVAAGIISGLTKVGEIIASPAANGIADVGNFENYFNN